MAFVGLGELRGPGCRGQGQAGMRESLPIPANFLVNVSAETSSKAEDLPLLRCGFSQPMKAILLPDPRPEPSEPPGRLIPQHATW